MAEGCTTYFANYNLFWPVNRTRGPILELPKKYSTVSDDSNRSPSEDVPGKLTAGNFSSVTGGMGGAWLIFILYCR